MVFELCDERVGTSVRALCVDDDVNLLEHLINKQNTTNPGIAAGGEKCYKPAGYVSGPLVVEFILPFPCAITRVQFTTTTTKPTQGQIWVSSKIPGSLNSRYTPREFFTLATSAPIAPPRAVVCASRDHQLSTGANLPLSSSPALRSCRCLRIQVDSFGTNRSLSSVSIQGDVGFLPRGFLTQRNVKKRQFLDSIEKLKRNISEQDMRKEEEEKKKKQSEKRKLDRPTGTTSTTSTSPTTATAAAASCDDSSPPEEFFDGVTLQLMERPVILPSGNTVDMSSLKRHEEEERKWGRPPSDPFTGLPFTETRAPVHHTSLEYRIVQWRRGKGEEPGRRLGSTNHHATTPLTKEMMEGIAEGVGSEGESVREKRARVMETGIREGKRPRILPSKDAKSSQHVITSDSVTSLQQVTSSQPGVTSLQPSVTSEEVVVLEESEGSSLDRMFKQIADHDKQLELF